MKAFRPISATWRFLRSCWLLAMLAVLLTLAQLIVRLVPFRYYARWLQRPVDGPDAPSETVHWLRRHLPRVAQRLPWRPRCLPQALVGRYLLARRGYRSQLSLGLAEGEDRLDAHAWLTSGGRYICGRGERSRFSEVAVF